MLLDLGLLQKLAQALPLWSVQLRQLQQFNFHMGWSVVGLACLDQCINAVVAELLAGVVAQGLQKRAADQVD